MRFASPTYPRRLQTAGGHVVVTLGSEQQHNSMPRPPPPSTPTPFVENSSLRRPPAQEPCQWFTANLNRPIWIIWLLYLRDLFVNCSEHSTLWVHSFISRRVLHQLQEKAKNKARIERTPAERKHAHNEVSARYRERHRETVRHAERERAANRRTYLNSLKEGNEELEAARARAREASARYRQKNREALALKQAARRKIAFVKKHGYFAYLTRALQLPPSTGRRSLTGPPSCIVHSVSRIPSSDEDRLLPSLLRVARPRGDGRTRRRVDVPLLRGLAGTGAGGLFELVEHRSWIARDQTNGFTDGQQKAFKKWRDVLTWWHQLCHDHHRDGCPPFDPITFTLDPPANTHPGTSPCTSSPPPRGSPPYPAVPIVPIAAGSPFAHSSSSSWASSSSTSSLDSLASSGLFQSDPELTPKKEQPTTPVLTLNPPPRVTLATHVQLTPTGRARGTAIVAAGGPAASAADAAGPAPAADAPAAGPPATVAATPTRGDTGAVPRESVLITPGHEPAAAPANPAPQPEPEPEFTYGIRGVAMFYPSHGAARAAARRLGMADARILASRNALRVQAWMYGEPFEGED
ncbi:hypothetical protein K438DRAFT_1780076 [Mycena galopus ATCC 62051]|nr:hypothetical protein K438DRAFT_1780076 [Mycena galopus ATCC 62051]